MTMPDILETIADCLLADHMALMAENAELRHKADKLNEAMLMLARLRSASTCPNTLSECDAILSAWFGEVRPHADN